MCFMFNCIVLKYNIKDLTLLVVLWLNDLWQKKYIYYLSVNFLLEVVFTNWQNSLSSIVLFHALKSIQFLKITNVKKCCCKLLNIFTFTMSASQLGGQFSKNSQIKVIKHCI